MAALFLLLAGCAAPATAPSADSVVPGTIGVLVGFGASGVVVTAVNVESRAAGLRVGDRVLSYNGQPVAATREFYRLVTDSPPGSVARLEVLRDGARRVIEVPVEQLDTAARS